MRDIERSIVIDAPLEKVWAAIADSSAFGRWFGAEFDGPFEPGRSVSARIVPTTMDTEIAAQQASYQDEPFTIDVVAVEPMHRFAFRWEASTDSPVRTTVEFTLTEEPDGVRVRITEDGFDRLPETLRERSRRDNDQGWQAQAGLLAAYVTQQP